MLYKVVIFMNGHGRFQEAFAPNRAQNNRALLVYKYWSCCGGGLSQVTTSLDTFVVNMLRHIKWAILMVHTTKQGGREGYQNLLSKIQSLFYVASKRFGKLACWQIQPIDMKIYVILTLSLNKSIVLKALILFLILQQEKFRLRETKLQMWPSQRCSRILNNIKTS